MSLGTSVAEAIDDLCMMLRCRVYGVKIEFQIFRKVGFTFRNSFCSLEELQEECDKEIQNREKMDEWRDEKNKLNSLLKKCRVKHNQLRGLDTSGNPTKVTEKLERLKVKNKKKLVSHVVE